MGIAITAIIGFVILEVVGSFLSGTKVLKECGWSLFFDWVDPLV